MKDTLNRLKKVTSKCRENMHEPDEQEIDAVVRGYDFDNAFGDDPHYNYRELTVGIKNKSTGHIEWFNLATLIALARKANL